MLRRGSARREARANASGGIGGAVRIVSHDDGGHVGILIDAWGAGFEAVHAAWERHLAHVASIRDRLPPGARAYAEAPWHYDVADPRCPHDAWVEHFHLHEPARGDRRERRRIDLEVRLLGAYHDGYLTFRYRNVVAYRVAQTNTPSARPFRGLVGHGDWLTDDIGISAEGFVTHDVLFALGGRWFIECEELTCEWEAGGYGPESPELDPDVSNRLDGGEGSSPARSQALPWPMGRARRSS